MDKWYDREKLDSLLEAFENSTQGRIPTEKLLDKEESLYGWREAISFLTNEGYLEESGDYFQITYKGSSFIHEGGFAGKHFRERVLAYSSIIAAVSSVLALLVSLIALLCEIYG